MKIKTTIKKMKGNMKSLSLVDTKSNGYTKRFKKYAFYQNKCIDEKQYEAMITRFNHTIEKGLAYLNFRAGFGKTNIKSLLQCMKNYAAEGYDKSAFFYLTALSTLQAYVKKNEACDVDCSALKQELDKLGADTNDNEKGGVIRFTPKTEGELSQLSYEQFVLDRHSMRHFSDEPVNIETVKEAIALAQHTPSACNRQGWRTIVINDKATLRKILKNQNGNEGFGHEFDKLLAVTADLRCFNRSRELYQAFIDGGMYAQSILNALHYKHIASVPLSASLSGQQEENVRDILKLNEAEELILFIGIGNYPDECQTARSERKPAEIEVI